MLSFFPNHILLWDATHKHSKIVFFPAGRSAAKEQSKRRPPGDIHRVLLALVSGREPAALETPKRLPLLAERGAPSVQRSCDVLSFYTILNEAAVGCAAALLDADDAADAARAAVQESSRRLVTSLVSKVVFELLTIFTLVRLLWSKRLPKCLALNSKPSYLFAAFLLGLVGC